VRSRLLGLLGWVVVVLLFLLLVGVSVWTWNGDFN
jgi:hypothetical protein